MILTGKYSKTISFEEKDWEKNNGKIKRNIF